MAKKSNGRLEQFKQQNERLRNEGYVPLGLADVISMSSVSEVSSDMGDWKDPKDKASVEGRLGLNEGGMMRTLSMLLVGKEDSVVKGGVENIGTKEKGYVKYGPGDDLAVDMARYANVLPYTAKAMEYNTDVKVGLGPRLMYHSSYYSNGALRDVCIPYGSAGTWLLGRIRDVRERLSTEGSDGKSPAGVLLFNNEGVGEVRTPKDEVGTWQQELDMLLADYEVWKSTWEEVSRFHAANDIEDHYMKCMLNDSYFDLYYPMIGLERGRPREWNAKIVSIGFRPTICCRMEEMDDAWRINYVYFSDKWRKGGSAAVADGDVVAYPALFADNFRERLEEVVAAYRNKPVGQRPLWFACPTVYSSVDTPYYPVPTWFSLFPTKVLDYASTLIYDKAIAKQNSTMWGKMVYVNLTYFQMLCDQRGCDTPEKAQELKAELQASINDFLKRRENKGKVLFTDSFLSDDQKQLFEAIKVVDVPTSTNAKETKDELEEIASIILFVFGIHPSLIGATPGKTPSSGGTQQRELHLLKQIQVSPRQRKYLAFLNRIVDWNGWDPQHACYEIMMPVLTTLDRNQSGIEMQQQG